MAPLLLSDKGSFDFELVLTSTLFPPGLVFSLPTVGMSVEEETGNEVSMGEDSGMLTSLRRPLCEPAPVVVLCVESKTLISTACGSVGFDPEAEGFAAAAEVEVVEILFEVDAPVPCPCPCPATTPTPAVDCGAAWSAIGRLFRGLNRRVDGDGMGTPPNSGTGIRRNAFAAEQLTQANGKQTFVCFV